MAERKCQAKGTFIHRPTAILVQEDVCKESEFNREILNNGLWNVLVGSWTLESGISLTIGVQNPSPPAETGIQCVESGIHGVESGMQDNLGFLYM